MDEIEQLRRAVRSLPPETRTQREVARHSLESALKSYENEDRERNVVPLRGGPFRSAGASGVRAAAVVLVLAGTGVVVGLAATRARVSGDHGHVSHAVDNRLGAGVTYSGPSLVSVSCVTRAACMTVGYDRPHGDGIAEWWDGRSFAGTSTAQGAALDSVSCRTVDFCVAVGHTEATSAPLIEFWNGRRWRISSVTRQNITLTSVSCTTISYCMAVGDSPLSGHPRALQWNGTRWRVLSTADGSREAYVLNALTCRSAAWCVAVGSKGFGNRERTLTEIWNGKRWRIVPSGNVGRPRAGVLNGVSCSSTRYCLAVGAYSGRAGSLQPLALFWNGSAWSPAKLPAPSGATSTLLNGISGDCFIYCMTVGEYSTRDGHSRPLAESWNAQTRLWTVRPVTNATRREKGALVGDACQNSISCIAVGYSEATSVATRIGPAAVGETWNGVEWKIRAAT